MPLSGDMALHGVEVQQAMNLALERMAREKNHYSYSLIFEDNELSTTKSVSAARKLIELDKVDAVLTLWPPTAEAVLPLTEGAGILHYTIAWDPDLAKRHRFLLSHQVMVEEIARSTLRLLSREGKRRVAFLHMEETGFNLGARYISSLAKEEGVALVADETFPPDETDFRPLILRSKSKAPDSYLVWSVMPSIESVVKQIGQIDPKVFISGYFDCVEDGSKIQNAPYISEMFAAEDFSKAYKAKFGSAPISKGPNAYDIVNLLITAYESSPTKKLNAAELKSYLVGVRDYPGAVGRFSIDSSGNSTYSPVVRVAKRDERSLRSMD